MTTTLEKPFLCVQEKIAWKHIQRIYPGAANVRIVQICHSGHWHKCADSYPLREIVRLYDTGYRQVQLRILHNGVEKFPDFQLEEWLDEFRWQTLDHLQVHANQGYRDAYVLAVIGNEALVEYEMPRGTTALRIIHSQQRNPEWSGRSVSYKALSKKWRMAIEDQGTEPVENPQ